MDAQPIGETAERAYFQQFVGDDLMEYDGLIWEFNANEDGALLLFEPDEPESEAL
jgi:hypothetical protein